MATSGDGDLTEEIESVAEGPRSVTTDAGNVTAQSIPDMIQADRYIKGSAAAGNANFGLRFTKLVPPGCG